MNPIWAMAAMVTSVTLVLSNSFGTNLPLTVWKGAKTLLVPELSTRDDESDLAGPAAPPPERRSASGAGSAAPWFEQPGEARRSGRFTRWRAWAWASAITLAVMGTGVFDVVAGGPIHPHV
ncbi:MAG: hypothetical protein ACRDYD_14715 [Acidimicrobiales bacterium]